MKLMALHAARVVTMSGDAQFCQSVSPPKTSDMTWVPQEQGSDRPWLEMVTTKKDREMFYSGGGYAFRNATYPIRYVRHEENRAAFMQAYFRYSFEDKLNSGKAILGLVKKWETVEGKKETKIIFGGVIVTNTTSSPKADSSLMFDIDPEATEISLKRDRWMQETIHSPMREVAASMGTVAWYLSRRVTMEEYRGKKYGAKYTNPAVTKILDQEMKRMAMREDQLKMPPIFYVASSDTFPSAFKGLEGLGAEMVGHYHFRHRSGLKCYLDSSVSDQRDICCTFLYVFKNVAPIVKKKLKITSPSAIEGAKL